MKTLYLVAFVAGVISNFALIHYFKYPPNTITELIIFGLSFCLTIAFDTAIIYGIIQDLRGGETQ